MRSLESFADFLLPIDRIVTDRLIPVLFGSQTTLNDEFREIFTLSPINGGLGLPLLQQEATVHHSVSKLVTQAHTLSIMEQDTALRTTDADGNTQEQIKATAKTLSAERKKVKIERLNAEISPDLLSVVKRTRDKRASSWLNALPVAEQKFSLNKEEFRDALRLRYNMPLSNLPSYCCCGEQFSIEHALSCKKGGFISKRHDKIRNLLVSLLAKVCHDVECEPHLLPLTGETLHLRSANAQDMARLDAKARSFWQEGVVAFFDVRVTHVNANSQSHLDTSCIFRKHEDSKKREYLQRVLEIDHGSFTH